MTACQLASRSISMNGSANRTDDLLFYNRNESCNRCPCCRKKYEKAFQSQAAHRSLPMRATKVGYRNYTYGNDDQVNHAPQIIDSQEQTANHHYVYPSEIRKESFHSTAVHHFDDLTNDNSSENDSQHSSETSNHSSRDNIAQNKEQEQSFFQNSDNLPVTVEEKQLRAPTSLNLEPDAKLLYNEQNIRELVNTVRNEIGALIDADREEQVPSSVSFNKTESHISAQSNNSSFDHSDAEEKFVQLSTRIEQSKFEKNVLNMSASKKKHISKTRSRSRKSNTKTSSNKKARSLTKNRRKSKSPRGGSKNTKRRPSKVAPRSNRRKGTKSKVPQTGSKNSKKRTSSRGSSKVKAKSSSQTKHDSPRPDNGQCKNCCCNFLHYSLRQVMRDAEQTKQFVFNTAMIGIDPLKLKDPTGDILPAICIPMSNCDNVRDLQFPNGPVFSTVRKKQLTGTDDHKSKNDTKSTIIQSINTNKGKIQIRLDPQSFGLAPFFSDQYETFIKGPPTSTFFTSYTQVHNDCRPIKKI